MTPKERVFAALEHREPDIVPWGEHSIDYNVYEDILGRPTFCSAKMKETLAFWDGRRDEIVESYKRDRVELVRALGMDIIIVHQVPPKGYRPERMEKIDSSTYRDKNGSIYHVSSTTHDLMPYQINTANYKLPTVADYEKRLAEIDSLPPDDPNDSSWDFVKHVVKELGKTHFVMLATGDLGFPLVGATEEDGWVNLVMHPELARLEAQVQGKWMLRALDVQSRQGVDGIMPPGDLGSSTGLCASPEIFREMVFPHLKAHVDKAHKNGLKVLKHCCGHVWPVIDDLADIYDAYEGIQASAGMDIGKLKERVGERLCLWGGIWHEHIIMGSTEDIRNDARYAFASAGPGGGFIMGSSHSLAVDAKAENILMMKKCRDEWGKYPIDPKKFT
jgi:hypothetical protein